MQKKKKLFLFCTKFWLPINSLYFFAVHFLLMTWYCSKKNMKTNIFLCLQIKGIQKPWMQRWQCLIYNDTLLNLSLIIGAYVQKSYYTFERNLGHIVFFWNFINVSSQIVFIIWWWRYSELNPMMVESNRESLIVIFRIYFRVNGNTLISI